MTKTAIFVEGHTELIFVREFLLRIFDYQVDLDCYTLFTDGNFNPTEYKFPNPNAENHFQIINAGNDNAVLSRILKREKYLFNSGFTKIVGLRDMYSKQYREIVKDSSIDPEINQRFIESHSEQISLKSENSDNIHFHFAIMEIEAWLLGIRKLLTKVDSKLTNDFIKEQLGIDLNELDPETAFFHPAKNLETIHDLVGKSYGKSKGDVNAIVGLIEKSDYVDLKQSPICQSFTTFYDSLLL